MQIKSKTLLLIAGISALSLGVVAVSVNSVKTDTISKAESVKGPVTFDSTALKSVVLEDIKLKGEEGPSDKKFRLPLDNGNYIDGAIVFNDCGLQYTGATLGDHFGINNTANQSNAYNFNILFSFENTGSISVDLTEESDTNDGSVYSYFELKYSDSLGGANFYENIANNYSEVTKRSAEAESAYYGDFHGELIELNNESSKRDDIYYKELDNLNLTKAGRKVFALQCTYHFIEGDYNRYFVQQGKNIEFFIRSLTFTYNCN